jgi:hypothetical protein
VNGVLHGGLRDEMGAVRDWVSVANARDFIGCLWASAVTGVGLGRSWEEGLFIRWI